MIRALLPIATTAILFGQAINPVQWTVAEKEMKIAPGQTMTIHITAQIEPEWHLYGLRRIDGGPIATTLTVEKDQAFQVAGPVGASPPVSANDPSFGVKVDYYLGLAHFELPVRALADIKPGQSTLKILARYQMCNDTLCLPPKTVAMQVPVEIEK